LWSRKTQAKCNQSNDYLTQLRYCGIYDMKYKVYTQDICGFAKNI